MSYKIVVDSCGEFTEEMQRDGHFTHVALNLEIDGEHFIDDDNFNRADFIEKMHASPNAPKSSCPSPEAYREAFDCGEDHVYAVTITAELSGSYNSAVLGKNLYLEEHPDAKVYVFNSRGASVMQSRIAQEVQRYEEAGCSFEEVVEKVENFIKESRLWFVLRSIENLRKNGRLSTVKALVANTLNIKPIMTATPEGVIAQVSQARGEQKAIRKMVDIMLEEVKNLENRVLGITHCNNLSKAEFIRDEVLKRAKVKDVVILESSGITTLYAEEGGIIITV